MGIIDNNSKKSSVFPDRIYDQEDLNQVRMLISEDFRHNIKIEGSLVFKNRIRSALYLIKSAKYLDFLRTYIRKVKETNGLSQLREFEASIWTNKYAVDNVVDAAYLLIQKSWQMKKFINGKAYYGNIAETLISERLIKFLEQLNRCTKDVNIKKEVLSRINMHKNSKFL